MSATKALKKIADITESVGFNICGPLSTIDAFDEMDRKDLEDFLAISIQYFKDISSIASYELNKPKLDS